MRSCDELVNAGPPDRDDGRGIEGETEGHVRAPALRDEAPGMGRVPAEGLGPWPRAQVRRAELLLEFIREHGAVHPREVDVHFAHGAVKNF